jgi:signal transduction histidine kinase
MQKAAQRMQNLIDDLLAYSRAGMQEKKFELTDIKEMFETVAEDIKEDILLKNATLQLSGNCRLNVIPFQFRQLLHNLISNSLKFSVPENPVVINIECKEEEINGKKNCHVSVVDNGIGFEQQYSEKIFELFQRLHGRMDYEGTGIGLAIVKKIVENHNGTISSSSKPGEGARFDIYIPLLQ